MGKRTQRNRPTTPSESALTLEALAREDEIREARRQWDKAVRRSRRGA